MASATQHTHAGNLFVMTAKKKKKEKREKNKQKTVNGIRFPSHVKGHGRGTRDRIGC